MQARMQQLEARNEVLEEQMLGRASRNGNPEVVYCPIGGECYHLEGCQHARVGIRLLALVQNACAFTMYSKQPTFFPPC